MHYARTSHPFFKVLSTQISRCDTSMRCKQWEAMHFKGVLAQKIIHRGFNMTTLFQFSIEEESE